MLASAKSKHVSSKHVSSKMSVKSKHVSSKMSTLLLAAVLHLL
jgi:hypothetical protein